MISTPEEAARFMDMCNKYDIPVYWSDGVIDGIRKVLEHILERQEMILNYHPKIRADIESQPSPARRDERGDNTTR